MRCIEKAPLAQLSMGAHRICFDVMTKPLQSPAEVL
jgi:hypothetical protein